MSLSRNFEEYKQEIELSCIQNRGVEIELYSIIACIIRESKQGKRVSVRDVSSRRSTLSYSFIEKYKSDAGFPDFIILQRIKDCNAKIFGCIEAKMPTVPINSSDEQIKYHKNCFNKVLYTNGIRWMYFENKETKFDIKLGTIIDFDTLEIQWERTESWNCLLEKIDNIKWDTNL